MKLTSQEEYGLRCLLQLAQAPDGFGTIHTIAEREALTPAYVAKLLGVLKRAHLVHATRGHNGGYQLARPAEAIDLSEILTALAEFMRPGGHIAITVRPWREHAELIDLPSQILTCGRNAGLIPVERCAALLARVAEHDFVARGSFFQRDFLRKQREAGLPLHLIAHEDVLVFRTPLRPSRSAAAGARAA